MNTIERALPGFTKAYTDWLYTAVARRLTGRPCKVEFVQPYIKKTRGLAARKGDTGIIQIRPGLGEDQTLETYLHEVAHVRLHFKGLMGLPKQARPESYRLTVPEGEMEAHEQREDEARTLAAHWEEYADENATGPELRHRLAALLDWREEIKWLV